MSENEKRTAREGLEGVVEDVKGKAKEAAGALSDDDELRREGHAQQDRAASQRAAAGNEAQAERERTEAADAEERQREHQRENG